LAQVKHYVCKRLNWNAALTRSNGWTDCRSSGCMS
jgi:hypothetical protein